MTIRQGLGWAWEPRDEVDLQLNVMEFRETKCVEVKQTKQTSKMNDSVGANMWLVYCLGWLLGDSM